MRRMALAFPLQHSFFGLELNYKPILHDEIFTLIYHSHGGFNWDDVYSMPIWLRRFYIKKLVETKNEENKAREGKTTKSNNRPSPPPIVRKK